MNSIATNQVWDPTHNLGQAVSLLAQFTPRHPAILGNRTFPTGQKVATVEMQLRPGRTVFAMAPKLSKAICLATMRVSYLLACARQSPKPKTVMYDCEIQHAPMDGTRPLDPMLSYARGWDDYIGMGISCVAAYSNWDKRYHLFSMDNLDEFQALVDSAEKIVGFNSLSFDDNLCRAHGLTITTNYDLLREVRVASGQPAEYVRGLTRKGYNLKALASANLDCTKNGEGADAPMLWQFGKIGRVVNYCLADVWLLRALYARRHGLIDPTNGKVLRLR